MKLSSSDTSDTNVSVKNHHRQDVRSEQNFVHPVITKSTPNNNSTGLICPKAIVQVCQQLI